VHSRRQQFGRICIDVVDSKHLGEFLEPTGAVLLLVVGDADGKEANRFSNIFFTRTVDDAVRQQVEDARESFRFFTVIGSTVSRTWHCASSASTTSSGNHI
jgi:hypothetical protein